MQILGMMITIGYQIYHTSTEGAMVQFSMLTTTPLIENNVTEQTDYFLLEAKCLLEVRGVKFNTSCML